MFKHSGSPQSGPKRVPRWPNRIIFLCKEKMCTWAQKTHVGTTGEIGGRVAVRQMGEEAGCGDRPGERLTTKTASRSHSQLNTAAHSHVAGAVVQSVLYCSDELRQQCEHTQLALYADMPLHDVLTTLYRRQTCIGQTYANTHIR